MAKNPLAHLTDGANEEADAKPARTTRPSKFANLPTRGAVGALNKSLQSTSENTIQELRIDQIRVSDRHDRFSVADEGMATLIESIRDHGQQIPILVRPVSDGEYEVVYGHRRLAALTALDMPVKAFVRKIGDTDAFLAAGHENYLRHDPSFAERSLWAFDALETGEVTREVICAAIGISEGRLSEMKGICTYVTKEVIQAIGAAPKIGRRPWLEAVALIREHVLNPADALTDAVVSLENSDERFDAWAAELKKLGAASLTEARKRNAKSTTTPVTIADKTIGTITGGGGKAVLKIDKKEAAFATWLVDSGKAQEVLQTLYEAWETESEAGV